MVIYTDHSAVIQIATQTSITTTSLVRMNTQYIRSSEFLPRFRLKVRHKPGKLNTVLDALSRLEYSSSIDGIISSTNGIISSTGSTNKIIPSTNEIILSTTNTSSPLCVMTPLNFHLSSSKQNIGEVLSENLPK